MAEPEFVNAEQNAVGSIDLIQYWRLFWRNKLLIITFGLLFAIPTAFIEKGKPNTYASTASLSVQQDQRSNIMDIEGLYGVNTQSRTYNTTQYEILKSRQLAERVISNLNLLENPVFAPLQTGADDASVPEREARLARALVRFSRSLQIRPVQNTSIVQITFTATNPQLAADIANGIARAYIEQDMEQRISATQQASRWLSERAAALNEDLRNSEDRLQAFLEREQLVDSSNSGDVTSLTNQQIDLLNTQLAEAQRRRREIESLYSQIEDLQNPTAEGLLAFPAVANHSSLQQVKQIFENINQQIIELSRRYGRNHPRMVALQSERDNAESNLVNQVSQVIRNEYQIALDSQNRIQAQLNESKAELQSINSKGFELQELRREVDTNRQLYEMFFTRVRETQETNDLMSTNAVLVDSAVPALYPSGPDRRRNVLMALVAGLMLGGGLVFARDLLSNTVKSYADIETRLHANVLGVVPLIKKEKSKGRKSKNRELHAITFQDTHSAFTESFRTIRTALDLASLEHPHKTLCITSSLPGEGKSTVAVNLASVLAQMGRRVLLVDTDMRKPTLAKLMDLPSDAPGLADYLGAKKELNDCLHTQENGHLIVMPAGKYTSDPLEMLSSDRFKRFIAGFSAKCDHIIFDSPPTQAVSDSLILCSIADAAIFVVKASSTPVKLIKNQLARLKRTNTRILGIVLNQLKDIEKNSDYGGYYDSYGYAANNDQDQKSS